MKKHEEFFLDKGIKTISFLFNNAHETEDYIIAGTRGWYHDPDAKNAPDNTDFHKLVNREAQRLRLSLKEAALIKKRSPEKEIIVFMHFPPFWAEKASDSLVEILKEYGIRHVFFGHIHGAYTEPPSFVYDDIEMHMISADYIEFIPKIVKF